MGAGPGLERWHIGVAWDEIGHSFVGLARGEVWGRLALVALGRGHAHHILSGLGLRVRVRVSVNVRVSVRVSGGLLPTTSHSISYTTVNAEGLLSGELSGDLCRHRMGPHSNDAGTLAA